MASRNAAQAPLAGQSPGAARDPKRWMILGVICLAYLMAGLDLTVMNVALPSAQKALAFTNADRQWIVTAYALASASLLLFWGRVADRVGTRTIFLTGLAGFAVASAVGGASTSFAMLVTARACQGVFAAMLAPSALSLVHTTFTDPDERGKAFGIFSAVVASGAGFGLILGGALTTTLNWRWNLYINLILAVISLTGGLLLLSKQPKTNVRMDIPGVLLASGGMFCVVFGFANAATHSWHTPSTWGFLAAGVMLLAVFGYWQTRSAQPLVPPRILLDRDRSGAFLAVLLVGTGIFGVLLFLNYYMQTTLGYSPIISGVSLLPMFVCTIVVTITGSVLLLKRYGPKPLISTGLLVSAGGMAWLTRIGAHSGYASHLLGPLIVLGLGMGLIYAAALNTATSGVAPQDAGIASSIVSVSQQLGGAIGTPLLNTVFATAVATWLAGNVHGTPSPGQVHVASVHGYTTVFWWTVAIFAAGAVVSGLLLRRGPLPVPPGAPGNPPTLTETERA